MRGLHECPDGTRVPVYTVRDSLTDETHDDGTMLVVGDESGNGSLWIDWAFHGDVPLNLVEADS